MRENGDVETCVIAMMIAQDEDGTPRLSQLVGRFVDELCKVQGHEFHHRQPYNLSATLKIEEDFLLSNLQTRGSRDGIDPGVALLVLAHARLQHGDRTGCFGPRT